MLRVLTVGLVAAALLHAIIYRVRMRRTRDADLALLPIGADGLIDGAQPITLDASPTHAVLLIHGFGDTPQSVRALAEFLHREHGWTVRAPLLPGHGRTLAAFDATRSSAWRELVHREFATLHASHDTVALVGLSMGAALATIEAARTPELPALVLLVPYLTPPARAERLAPLATIINLCIPYLAGGDRVKSIFDPVARAQAIGYGAAPPTRIRDLVTVAHDARFAAEDVRAPTLLIHSRTDYRIPVHLAEMHETLFSGASERRQDWVEGCGHVITVDFCREQVWAETAAWLARFAGAPGRPLS